MWPYLHAIICAQSVQEQDVGCPCKLCALSNVHTQMHIYTCIDFNILVPIGLYILGYINCNMQAYKFTNLYIACTLRCRRYYPQQLHRCHRFLAILHILVHILTTYTCRNAPIYVYVQRYKQWNINDCLYMSTFRLLNTSAQMNLHTKTCINFGTYIAI